VSASSARRLTTDGPPRSWSERDLEDFAAQLYARADVVSRTRDPGARAELERRRKLPTYAEAAKVAAAQYLRLVVSELEGRRPCEPGTWSPRSGLARELGVSSVRLGRWLERGRVPSEFMPQYATWAEERAQREIRRIREQAQIEELIQAAKKPELQHTLSGSDAKAKQKARAPDLKTGEFRTESEQQSGYQWVLRVEKWCSFELIDAMVAWAEARRRPKGQEFSQSRNWIVTALCNIYDRASGNRKGRKSPGAFREFSGARQKERGTHLQLNVPVSSRTVKTGGLARAVRLFRDEMTIEHCDNEYVFVAGLIVRNWRWRTDAERKNYRDRVQARLDNEFELAKRALTKKAAKIRSRAKKQALGRRGSAAGGRGTKRPTPAGARSRRKKRS
jgi:transposase-like protein